MDIMTVFLVLKNIYPVLAINILLMVFLFNSKFIFVLYLGMATSAALLAHLQGYSGIDALFAGSVAFCVVHGAISLYIRLKRG